MISGSNLKLIIIMRICTALSAAVVIRLSNGHTSIQLSVEEVDLIDIMFFGIFVDIFNHRLRVRAPRPA
ncbi:hypothetical protein D3C75_561220 [compost metagenome]